MFTKLVLKNFKAWHGAHTLDLKPVTLVLGVNSAGKTSLLQPLLLLKQTAESPDRKAALDLGKPGDLVDLGALADVVAGHDLGLLAPEAVKNDPLGKKGFGFRLTFGPVAVGEGTDARTSETVEYQVDYGADEDGVPHVRRLEYYADFGAYGAARDDEGKYVLSAPSYGPEKRRPGRTYEPERSVSFSADAIAALGEDGMTAQDLSLALTEKLQRVQYLGPHREAPRRSFPWNGRAPTVIGPSGENAVAALAHNMTSKHLSEEERGRLVVKVSEWLARLGVADKIEIEPDTSASVRVMITHQGTRANLLDVGFGVSQVLPVIVMAYFAPRGTTLIFAEPELHLHPLAQAALGDLLVEVAKERGIQVLCETHSEHLFRRLQTLIAEERLLPGECSLLFVDRKDGRAAIKALRVNAYGRVENWPDKFFGDAIGETERQMDRAIARMEEAEREEQANQAEETELDEEEPGG